MIRHVRLSFLRNDRLRLGENRLRFSVYRGKPVCSRTGIVLRTPSQFITCFYNRTSKCATREHAFRKQKTSKYNIPLCDQYAQIVGDGRAL